MAQELKITTLDDLKKIKDGEIVELPPFTKDVPFVARLQRPSMLVLAKSGKIPNSLLTDANKLFAGGAPGLVSKNLENDNMMQEMFELMEVICEAALVEPAYKDLKDNGIQLTDEQLMAIFSYTQEGVKSLEKFRK